ncbi:hypothetical protein Pst134EA_009101 [Puccinia striiformis f. sp. tritici]|uniref:hypothetical protein n=1 Tax=Puccinia striiformis f. sp. tritici TaxID=168172 RepID=UPI0020082DA1|nr:hypothetical protein Pst134EA_009101 [Puccinia striiformis f. sp. tritici]KAH9457823.1 hypothetical protein Pst134EB_010135 [Puccinia striiformis f. sp. tritici]KAH9468563.1 hypothetical protein Pst134EA_009101 [Puccinia striiformis f. sp. tritici]
MTDQDAANTIELPPLTPIILRACSFQNWYTTFSQYTFQSTIITLDQAFIEYLRDNCHGLHLPEDLTPVSTYTSQLSDSEDGNDIGEVSPTGSPSSSRSSSPPPDIHFRNLRSRLLRRLRCMGVQCSRS